MELMDLDKQEVAPFYRVKGLLIGNQGVGKSSLVNMFDKDFHDPNITATIGIEFASFLYELKDYPLDGYLPNYYFENINQVDISLNLNSSLIVKNSNLEKYQAIRVALWDSSGSERFSTIVKSYLRDVDFAFLVFDMTNRKSWDDLVKWKKDLENAAKYNRLPMLILVGTKSDLYPYVVTREEIEVRSKEWNAKSYIVSCIQQNSSSSIKRMLYRTLCDFHENMLHRCDNEEIVPEHVTKYYHETHAPLIDIGATSTPFCCNIM